MHTPFKSPIENYFLPTQCHFFLFVCTYFYLWESLLIYDELWESFLNHSHLLAPILISENLFSSVCTYFYLWESVFLSLYENKPAYEYCHHLKEIFYHQNTIVIFCWFHKYQFYVFLLWILFILCLTTFLLNRVFLNSLKSVMIFPPFCCIRFFTINIFHRMHLWF